MKPSSIGIGFSHQSVPVVVEDGNPLRRRHEIRVAVERDALDEIDDRVLCGTGVPGRERLRHS
jgi:hypothetical protein